jgi:hypothetical protein
MRRTTITTIVLVGLALPALAGGTKDYVDPTQAFAISVPEGWQSNRAQLGESGWNTEFTSPGGASFGVMNFPAAGGTSQAKLDEIAQLLFGAVLGDLQQNGQVQSEQPVRTKLGALDAMKCALKYQPNQGPAESGYLLVLLGQKNAFLVYVSAPATDAAGFRTAESCLATLALEAAKPNAAGGAGGAATVGGSLLTSSALASAAAKIKGGPQRDAADKVLVENNPPLTYSSVVNFVQILQFACDIELTETEFESVQQRFVECFPKLDDQGKTILAQGGANILAGISKDNPEERARQRKDIQDNILPVLQRQAQQGIPYAAALWEAIQRRGKTVLTVQAARPEFAERAQLKTEMTEADLEAALEMLYFMWVASGRDPNLVTQEAVVTVRAALVQNFAAFPPQLQYLLANAQKVYAGLRGQWEQADAATKAQLAAGYGQTLDSLGLTVPRPGGGGGGGGAWSDVKPEDMSSIRAEAMANAAFLSTNSWYKMSH